MKILIAGDFYPASQLKPLIESGDYRVLQGIMPIIRQADYSIVNFESPVLLGNYKPIEKCGPNLKSSKKAIEAIKYAGFDMVTLANNHILDYGELGIKDTLKGDIYDGIYNSICYRRTYLCGSADPSRPHQNDAGKSYGAPCMYRSAARILRDL